ncbi:hypothetical protein PLIIFM63780_002302 [Purpureocillium lilacinum]|nr:hypothetical protein PLIIFM63780_002302 [Purpureocillium lilacinum]
MDPVTGRTARLDWIAPSYPSPGELDLARDSNRLQEAWTYDQTNCAAYKPVKVSLVVNGNIQSSGYQNDHGIERQMLRLWGDDALLGRLRDAESSDFILNGNYYRVPFNYFEISLQQVFSVAGKASERIMDALGSKINRDAMTLMIQDMNLKKEKMWTNKEEVIAPKQMENWTYGTKTTAANPAKAIEEIRRVIMNQKSPHSSTVWSLINQDDCQSQ